MVHGGNGWIIVFTEMFPSLLNFLKILIEILTIQIICRHEKKPIKK